MASRMVMVRDMTTDTDMELPLSELIANDRRYRVLAWDEDAGEFKVITRREAYAALFSYAETLTPGSWAAWAAYERAAEMAADDLPWNKKLRNARKTRQAVAS